MAVDSSAGWRALTLQNSGQPAPIDARWLVRWYRKHPLTDGHPFYMGTAVGFGLLTALLIFPAVLFDAREAATDPGNQVDITVFVTLTFAFIGVAVGGIGALARAVVHNRSETSDKIVDHLGKLLAVSAFVFSFMGAFFRLSQTLYMQILVGVLVLMMLVAMAFRPALKRHETARAAAAAAQAALAQQTRDAAERERKSTRRRSHAVLALSVLALLMSTLHLLTSEPRKRRPSRPPASG